MQCGKMSPKDQIWRNVNLRTPILKNICELLLLIFVRYPWDVEVGTSHINIRCYDILQVTLLLLFGLFCKLPTNKIIVTLNNKCYINTRYACRMSMFLTLLVLIFKHIGSNTVEKWIHKKPIRNLISESYWDHEFYQSRKYFRTCFKFVLSTYICSSWVKKNVNIWGTIVATCPQKPA